MSVSDDIRRADEAASVAHDFICGKNDVTEKQASDAIWRIHDALRPYIPLLDRTDDQAKSLLDDMHGVDRPFGKNETSSHRLSGFRGYMS